MSHTCCNGQFKCLFGVPDLKMTPQVLSTLAFMCTPDRPVDEIVTIGDFGFTEVCITEKEISEFKAALIDLCTPEQHKFVQAVVWHFKNEEANRVCHASLVNLAESMEAEFARLCNVIFQRFRCFEARRISSMEVIGRVISFPDQVSDDYGNNLDAFIEKFTNPLKAGNPRAKTRSEHSTVFVGHGQGASVAQLLGCLRDEPVLIFEGTYLSSILARNAMRFPRDDLVEFEERKKTEGPWTILWYSMSQTVQQHKPILETVNCIVDRVTKQLKEEERERNKDKPENIHTASVEKYFANCNCYAIYSHATADAFVKSERSGRIAASTIRKHLNDSMTIVKEIECLHKVE